MMDRISKLRMGEILLKLQFLSAIAVLLTACAAPATNTAEPSGFVSCPAERAQICTREYRPVCGHIQNSGACQGDGCQRERHRSFGNGCSACADSAVIGYEFGSCESFGK